MTTRDIPCPFCNRKFFNALGRFSHAQKVHQGVSLKAIVPDEIKTRVKKLVERGRVSAREPSIAEQFIDAQINGFDESTDWMRSMLP